MKEKEEPTCTICLEPAGQTCSRCQSVRYCSREHQKEHWKQHRLQCTSTKVKEDEKLGRYLEATREIKSGDIVLKEKPLITGPYHITPPVCLGCYKLLEKGKTVVCGKCGWPCCSKACTKSDEHKPECHYTHKRGEKVSISTFGEPHPYYECITILRCLYQRDHNKKLWAKLQSLQSHCEDRKGTEKWNVDKKIAEFIWKFFKLDGTFSEEEIMRCCGIIQINCHEVPVREVEYVALFNLISMVEHNCRANCYKTFTSKGEMLICAGMNIAMGSHISMCYTDPLWGTEARRFHLAAAWFFECCCERCSDVTEFGTMYDAIKCGNGDCKGYLLPETFLVPVLHKTKNPNPETRNLDDKMWVCNSCKGSATDAIVQKLLQDIEEDFRAVPKDDPDACERFIRGCRDHLHPYHYFMTEAILALALLIGQHHEDGLVGATDDKLLLKTQLCKKLVDLLERLIPGESRLRGSLLIELHTAISETGMRKSQTEGPMVLLNHFTESRKVLTESVFLLRHEPLEMTEGKMVQQAKMHLVHIDEVIGNLSFA